MVSNYIRKERNPFVLVLVDGDGYLVSFESIDLSCFIVLLFTFD
jgi:hypothetical protein